MTATVAMTVSLIVACSDGTNPAGPNTGEQSGGGDGKVTAACPGCFPGPAPVPGGPVPVPVPGAPGSGTGGGGASPSPSPSASASPGASPSPGSSPSPSPSASPFTCPTQDGVLVTSPTLITGGTGTVTVGKSSSDPNFAQLANCEITGIVRVTVHMTTTDVALTFGGGSMRQYVTVADGSDNDTQTLMDAGYKPATLTGTQLGTGCGSSAGFSFGQGGTDLTAATAPYSGVYDPGAAGNAFTSSFFGGHTGQAQFTIGFLGLGADATVECAQVVYTLAPKP